MNLNELLDIAMILGGVIGLVVLFFFCFTNEKVKNAVNIALAYLPAVLTMALKFVKDKKGVFDTYDALTLMASVSERIRTTIDDPTNKTFADVEEEVFDIVRDELAKYKNLPGVPQLDDPAVRVQVRVVFQAIQKALLDENEDS